MKSSKRKSTISESEVPSQSNSSSLHRSPPPPPLPPQERTIKLLVIGELGTGKTAVIQRYVKNVFSGHYRSTVRLFYLIKISINITSILDWCRYCF